MRSLSLAFLICLHNTLFSTTSIAQEWANFKARFVYDGKAPERKPPPNLKIDSGAPKDLKVLDESLIVDEKTKGIANIVLWIIPDPDKPDAKMPIHSSYDTIPSEHVIRIKDHAFSPHISTMRAGQSLVILGEDSFYHYADFSVNQAQPPAGRSLPSGNRHQIKGIEEEKLPIPLRCAIHPFERAYVLVRNNPYFAVTDEKGEFEIKNLPIGEWRFKVWHEKAGYLTDVKLGKSDQKWPKGEFKIKVEKIDFYLGEVTVPAKMFDK